MDYFDLHTTKIKAIDSRTSMFANWWAIRNSVPYLHLNKRWLTVSYERLYLYPEAELERISAWLGTDVTKSALQKISRPSATTIAGSAIAEGGDQLANWQKILNQQKVAEILEIVHSYGIDAYSEDLEPDYGKLGY